MLKRLFLYSMSFLAHCILLVHTLLPHSHVVAACQYESVESQISAAWVQNLLHGITTVNLGQNHLEDFVQESDDDAALTAAVVTAPDFVPCYGTRKDVYAFVSPETAMPVVGKVAFTRRNVPHGYTVQWLLAARGLRAPPAV